MSDMSVNSVSARVTASYGVAAVKCEPEKRALDFSHAVRMDEMVERMSISEEDAWKLWAKVTETTAEDGTVTKTISRSFDFIGPSFRGKEEFSFSVSFDAESYQMGDLTSTVDLMAAAYEAYKVAKQDRLSGMRLMEQSAKLEASYQEAKDEVANSFAQLVGVSLEARGQVGQVKKIYDSVQAAFLSYEAKYHSVALRTPNSWAKAGVFEATINLQRLGASIKPEVNKENGLYTLRELELTAAGLRGSLNRRV